MFLGVHQLANAIHPEKEMARVKLRILSRELTFIFAETLQFRHPASIQRRKASRADPGQQKSSQAELRQDAPHIQRDLLPLLASADHISVNDSGPLLRGLPGLRSGTPIRSAILEIRMTLDLIRTWGTNRAAFTNRVSAGGQLFRAGLR